MNKEVTWTKGTFDSAYQVFCDGQICGNLIFETWNNNALGIMWQKNYKFRSNGLMHLSTLIHGDNGEELGRITFHIWQLKAIIALKKQAPFSWAYTNSWLSEWSMDNYQGTKLSYKAGTGTGVVNGENLDDELTLLAGIYVKEYFSRILISIIGFVVIMVIVRRF